MANLYKGAGARKRNTSRHLKWYISGGIILLLVLGFLYVFAGTALFRVKAFQVVGATDVQADTILRSLRPQVAATWLGGLLGPDHYFAWGKNISYQDVRFSAVTLEKHFWARTIDLTVVPRERYIVWCLATDDTTCYWVDQTGYAFDSAPALEGQLVFAVTESASSTRFTIGDSAIDAFSFAVIKKIILGIREMSVNIQQAVIVRPFAEFRLTTVSGTDIIFSLRFDPTLAALPALQKFKAQGLERFSYLDLSAENRALVKPK